MHADLLGAPWPQATPHLALRAYREAMDTEDYDWKLLSGATVFARPSQYRAVMQALAASHTTPSSEMVRQLPQGRLIHAIMLTIATMIFRSRRRTPMNADVTPMFQSRLQQTQKQQHRRLKTKLKYTGRVGLNLIPLP